MIPRLRLPRLAAPLIAAALALGGTPARANTFFAEGSDTIFAAGARYIAMGGTGVSTANDPHAVFYNPAMLGFIDTSQIAVTRQLNAELRPYTFTGVTLPVAPLSDIGLDVTLGFARYNRVHARGTGVMRDNDVESVFLRFLLPGINGTLTGTLDSKTLVNRAAIGIAPQGWGGLSFGANIDLIDCKSHFCGVRGSTGLYTVANVHAVAVSYGVSVAWKPSDRFTLGAAWTDIGTTLNTENIVTDAAGTRVARYTTKLPSRLQVEASLQLTDRLLVAAGYQRVWGLYGDKPLDVQTAHLGVEYDHGDGFTSRAGVWKPIKYSLWRDPGASLSVPIIPTAGMALRRGHLNADFALYVHPLMSFSQQRPVVSADLTLGWTF